MFQATLCPSSGETTVFMRHLVLVILYGWLSGMWGGMNTRQSCIQNNKYQVSHRYSYFSWWLSGMQEHMLLHTRQSSTQNNKYQVSHKHSCFSWWLSGMQKHMLLHTRQSSTQNNKYQVSHRYSYLSWWWAQSSPKHIEKRNKHITKNCAPSWLYLQDYTGMLGQ